MSWSSLGFILIAFYQYIFLSFHYSCYNSQRISHSLMRISKALLRSNALFLFCPFAQGQLLQIFLISWVGVKVIYFMVNYSSVPESQCHMGHSVTNLFTILPRAFNSTLLRKDFSPEGWNVSLLEAALQLVYEMREITLLSALKAIKYIPEGHS